MSSPVEGETIDESLGRMQATNKAWNEGGTRARWNARHRLVCSHRTLEEMITPETQQAHWHFHTRLFLGAVTPANEAVAVWTCAACDRHRGGPRGARAREVRVRSGADPAER